MLLHRPRGLSLHSSFQYFLLPAAFDDAFTYLSVSQPDDDTSFGCFLLFFFFRKSGFSPSFASIRTNEEWKKQISEVTACK